MDFPIALVSFKLVSPFSPFLHAPFFFVCFLQRAYKSPSSTLMCCALRSVLLSMPCQWHWILLDILHTELIVLGLQPPFGFLMTLDFEISSNFVALPQWQLFCWTFYILYTAIGWSRLEQMLSQFPQHRFSVLIYIVWFGKLAPRTSGTTEFCSGLVELAIRQWLLLAGITFSLGSRLWGYAPIHRKW